MTRVNGKKVCTERGSARTTQAGGSLERQCRYTCMYWSIHACIGLHMHALPASSRVFMSRCPCIQCTHVSCAYVSCTRVTAHLLRVQAPANKPLQTSASPSNVSCTRVTAHLFAYVCVCSCVQFRFRIELSLSYQPWDPKPQTPSPSPCILNYTLDLQRQVLDRNAFRRRPMRVVN